MRKHSAADVASAIEIHGCFGFDLFGRFKKLTDTEKAAVLDIIANFYRHEQEWFDNPESFDPELGLEDSPGRAFIDAPSSDRLDSSKNHPVWKYGWPHDKLPKFGSDSQEIGADDTAVEDEQPEQETVVPPYLTTSDLVGCFCGYMGVTNPAKVLSEYPRWATKDGALVQRGRKGAPSKSKPDISAWNPVQFALNLLDKKPLPKLDGLGYLTQQHLDTVFSMKSLAEWKPIWITKKPL
jgi:hypothetical protein